MKIDSIDKVTSFDSPVSEPLGNEDKSIMTTKKTAGLSDLNYTPYKSVNITGQAKKAYNYYLNRGVKPNVAAGIVGNLYKESGLNPMAVGDKGTAFGVAQWRGDRLSNLKNYASSKGRSYTDLNTQLDFILDEQGENQVLSLMGNQSPEEAAKTFADKYERPNPKYADYSTRSSVAKQLGQMKYGGIIPRLQVGGKPPRKAGESDRDYSIRTTGRPSYGNPFKDIYNQAKDKLKKTYDKDGVLGIVDEVMSAPARGVTKAITGKYQDPSEALDIKNPYAKFAVDMVLDPTNLIGVGSISKGVKLMRGMKTMKKSIKIVDPTATKLLKTAYGTQKRIFGDSKQWSEAAKYLKDNDLIRHAWTDNVVWKQADVARKMGVEDAVKSAIPLVNDLINIDKPNSGKSSIINSSNTIPTTINSNTSSRKKLPSLSNTTAPVKNKPQYSIPRTTEVQNTNPIVKPETSIDSVSLPSEEVYTQPIVQRRPRRHTESIQDYEDSFKSKPKTSGQQNYELNSDYVQRLHQENVKGTKMKPKLIRNAFGGFIPKHALGAGEIMGLISQGMNLGAGFIDSTNDPENPNVAKSGISGFIKGNAALPGIGGILGGISGIRDAKKQRELFQKKKDIENRGVMDYFNIRSKGILDNYNTQGEESSFYAKGGIPNPQYEVEHGEVIVGDDVKLTGGKQLASNLHKVIGKTHDQSNPNTVNGTGEDGQGGQFIFSNRLKLGGKTFAKLAEGVAKQKAKAEEMMSHNDYIFKNTGQANAEIADAKLQQLAQIQEIMKGETNPVGQFKFGGSISKYDKGKSLNQKAGELVSNFFDSLTKKTVPDNKSYEKWGTEQDALSKGLIKKGDKYYDRSGNEYKHIANGNYTKVNEVVKTNNIPKSVPSAPTTPQGTNRPSGNRLNLDKNKANPLATENANLPVQSGNTQPNQFTGTVEPYSVNLPKEETDFSYSVQGNNNFSPIRKVREKGSGINTDDLAPVAGALMSGINYFANQNMINKYKTQTPATLLQNPNYQYFDRSGNARTSVRGITNSIMNNPILNQGTKQAALANSMNVMNEVNQQELNRKQEYDRTYRGQQLETENRNAMILNQARQQTMQNENQKQGLRQDNLNNLFGNINTNLAEFQANKQQDKAMQYLSLPYFKRLNLSPAEQEQFKKNPTSFLMGQNEVEVPKNKKGGRIKMKYC